MPTATTIMENIFVSVLRSMPVDILEPVNPPIKPPIRNNRLTGNRTKPERLYLIAVVIPNVPTAISDVPTALFIVILFENSMAGTSRKPPPMPKYPAPAFPLQPDNLQETYIFAPRISLRTDIVEFR